MSQSIRIATFNIAFDHEGPGQLATELLAGQSPQAHRVAEILQRTRPDMVLLTEFDHDGSGAEHSGLTAFQEHFLDHPHGDAAPIHYPYRYLVPSNTGLAAGIDLDGDGKLSLPGDAQGFGHYHGQYAMAVLSRYPLLLERRRSFQHFLWRNMPGALLPDAEPGSGRGDFYSPEALAVLRLSSKNHLDLPVLLPGGRVLHLLALHPTPPVFDGPERRNARRNHDEIRLFCDYIDGADYLVDDQGQRGGLAGDASFVLLGDLNADPHDGDGLKDAIRALLAHPRLNTEAASGRWVPASLGASAFAADRDHQGPKGHWTHIYPLRLDYVLPSANLEVTASGVYWPKPGNTQRHLVEQDGDQGKGASSDHRLVWVEIQYP
ncbi:endonuclease/exonuclease/phosphatase family protein [Gallaecimonas sp. GXIMD4217]|uniref:endonuclease/exonuclease/phosphatase family protein n=1 Tax=Gallaecimonas sp. GXIMD4217 TaxID=3131927 RepID=UPI00311AE1A4